MTPDEYEERKREQEMIDQWHRAQKAMLDVVIEIIGNHNFNTHCPKFRLLDKIEELRMKYGGKVE